MTADDRAECNMVSFAECRLTSPHSLHDFFKEKAGGTPKLQGARPQTKVSRHKREWRYKKPGFVERCQATPQYGAARCAAYIPAHLNRCLGASYGRTLGVLRGKMWEMQWKKDSVIMSDFRSKRFRTAGRIWLSLYTRVGTLIVATIYLQLIQNRYMFRSFTVLQCSHQHCVQAVASDVEVVGYL